MGLGPLSWGGGVGNGADLIPCRSRVNERFPRPANPDPQQQTADLRNDPMQRRFLRVLEGRLVSESGKMNQRSVKPGYIDKYAHLTVKI
jgi:hypothetical protein